MLAAILQMEKLRPRVVRSFALHPERQKEWDSPPKHSTMYKEKNLYTKTFMENSC